MPRDVLKDSGGRMQTIRKKSPNWRFFVVTGAKRDEYLNIAKIWLGIKDFAAKQNPHCINSPKIFLHYGDAPAIIFAYSHHDAEETLSPPHRFCLHGGRNMNLACLVEGLGSCTMGATFRDQTEVDAFLG